MTVTIPDPSFEGSSPVWGFDMNPGMELDDRVTGTGVTDGTYCERITILAWASRSVGDYGYITNSITVNNDFKLIFDYYSDGNTKYDLVVSIGSTEIYTETITSSGQVYNKTVTITGYSGAQTLRIGLKCTSATTTEGKIYFDNFRTSDINLCQSTGAILVGNTYNGYGDIKHNSINCSANPETSNVDITDPWSTTHSSITVSDGYFVEYSNGDERYSVTCYAVFCGPTIYAVQFDECYYIETNERYVKTTGDDSKTGLSWTNAWATINKAATTVADGTTVHIGHGTYNSEPAGNTIAPVNAGSTGIKYKPVTADTGAEVAGSVTIEKN